MKICIIQRRRERIRVIGWRCDCCSLVEWQGKSLLAEKKKPKPKPKQVFNYMIWPAKRDSHCYSWLPRTLLKIGFLGLQTSLVGKYLNIIWDSHIVLDILRSQNQSIFFEFLSHGIFFSSFIWLQSRTRGAYLFKFYLSLIFPKRIWGFSIIYI